MALGAAMKSEWGREMPSMQQFAEDEWRHELATGFALLKRIPSDSVQQALAVFKRFPEKYGLPFLRKMSAGRLTPEHWDDYGSDCARVNDVLVPLWTTPREQRLQLQHLLTLRDETLELGFTGRQWANVLKKHGTSAQQLESWLHSFQEDPEARAGDIRRALFPAISSAYSCQPKKEGGGCWRFSFRRGRRELFLDPDFGGMRPGFHHELRSGRKSWNYLRILGFVDPSWNMIRSSILAEVSETFIEATDRTLRALTNSR